MQRIVLASNNHGKIKEFNRLLSGGGYEVVAQADLGIESIEETGLTFIENAILKARHASAMSGLPALADDSGIEVDALNGEPGIYSARYAGAKASDAANNQRLLQELERRPDKPRSARYQCILAYMRHASDPSPLIVQAQWKGEILEAARGEGGFGYDPLFWVPSHQCSAAELDAKEKNRISHRGQAMRKLLAALSTLDKVPT